MSILAERPLPPEEEAYQEWYRSLAVELGILRVAANRLRWLAWSWFFLFGMSFVLSLLMAGVGALRAVPIIFIIGLILLGISGLYFVLARYVARGHRWAIGCSLFLGSLCGTLLLMRIFTPQGPPAGAIFDTIFLIATLNLLKSLCHSWGASRRIWRMAQPTEDYVSAPVDTDLDWPRRG